MNLRYGSMKYILQDGEKVLENCDIHHTKLIDHKYYGLYNIIIVILNLLFHFNLL